MSEYRTKTRHGHKIGGEWYPVKVRWRLVACGKVGISLQRWERWATRGPSGHFTGYRDGWPTFVLTLWWSSWPPTLHRYR